MGILVANHKKFREWFFSIVFYNYSPTSFDTDKMFILVETPDMVKLS